MFKIGIQKTGCGKAAITCDVKVNTLPEVEAKALEFASTIFPGKDIRLVYEEDSEENALIYYIYEGGVSEHIGRVGIKSL